MGIFARTMLIPVVLWFSSVAVADSPPQWDRAQAEKYDWIYDDFDKAVAKANETGKPMLCVLRCPP